VSLIFVTLWDLWVLDNVVILRLSDRCRIWVFLPLYEIRLLFHLFLCVLHSDLWVCDISVLQAVFLVPLLVPVNLIFMYCSVSAAIGRVGKCVYRATP
jgi:hypothetical protein